MRTVVEFSDNSSIVLPDDVTVLLLQWLESLTFNGFSNVHIKSKKLNHEISIVMEAGSIHRGKVPSHQVDSIKKALHVYRHKQLKDLGTRHII